MTGMEMFKMIAIFMVVSSIIKTDDLMSTIIALGIVYYVARYLAWL